MTEEQYKNLKKGDRVVYTGCPPDVTGTLVELNNAGDWCVRLDEYRPAGYTCGRRFPKGRGLYLYPFSYDDFELLTPRLTLREKLNILWDGALTP